MNKPSAKPWSIEVHESLPSTQDFLRERVDAGAAPEFFAVQALSQSGGRGRQGRVWVSPPGNLYLSVYLRPDVPLEELGQIAFVAALAAYKAASRFIDRQQLMLKWPNDLLRGGEKLAGILIENAGQGRVLLGLGMNVNAPPDGAAGLEGAEVGAVRDAFLDALVDYYGLWRDGGFAEIRRRWLERAHKKGTRLVAGGHEGIFEEVDPSGALLLRDNENNIRRVSAGDVNLI